MKKPQVLMRICGLGEIVLELEHYKAPVTAGHFLSLVDMGFYDQTLIHKISPVFTIAGGEQNLAGRTKPVRRTILNEAFNGLKNQRYTLAMDRKISRDSVGTGFFINIQDNQRLDYRDASHEGSGYPVFGRVIEGFEVVDKIAQLARKKALFQEDQPAEPVVIERVQALH